MNKTALEGILDILQETAEDSRYPVDGELIDSILGEIEGTAKDGKTWVLARNARIMLAQRAIELGVQFENVINLLTWKDFEGFVAHILSQNGFRCIESFRRRGNQSIKGMEIDVIGARGNTIVSADAKMWGIRKGKSSALKAAAESQRERSMKLIPMMKKVAERLGPLTLKKYEIYPVLVTWLVEEVQFHEGVPIVPIFKLNSFILSFDLFQDLMVNYLYEKTDQ